MHEDPRDMSREEDLPSRPKQMGSCAVSYLCCVMAG